jgi:hypothetical protein
METPPDLNKIISISNKTLDEFSLKNHEYLVDSTYYDDKSGIQEYRLYSYLTEFFNEITILDIGTYTGRSAVALSHNESNRVISYNIVDDIQHPNHPIYKKSNIEFRIKDVMDDLTRDFIHSYNVQIVMIDIDDYGKSEKLIIERLRDIGFSGIIIIDDTHHPEKEMGKCMKRLWEELDHIGNLKKYDFTSYGHCSGTGVLLMNTPYIQFQFPNELTTSSANKVRLIFLIISSNNDPSYTKMKKFIGANYARIKDKIKYFFIEHTENITGDVVELGNHIYIKGKETFIPGIYDKTIKAIEHVNEKYDYDYLIRTNLSSFWIVENALRASESFPSTRFAGGFPYQGFLSGTCMILSKDVSKIVCARHIPDSTVIDDVTISRVIESNGVPFYNITQYKWGFLTSPPEVSYPSNCRVLTVSDEDISDILFFRSKSFDRNMDVENFKRLLKRFVDK